MGTRCHAISWDIKLQTGTCGGAVITSIYQPGQCTAEHAEGVMQGKPTEREQANHARDESQPRLENITLGLLRGPPQTRFSSLPLRSHSHDHIPCEVERMLNG